MPIPSPHAPPSTSSTGGGTPAQSVETEAVLGKRTRPERKGKGTLIGGGGGGGDDDGGDEPPRAVNKCTRGGGGRVRRARGRQAQVQNFHNQVRNLGPNNAYDLLDNPALQPRVDVDVFFLHLTNGVCDFDVFTANVSLLLSALRSNSSSTFMSTLNDMDGAFGCVKEIRETDVSDAVQEVMRAKNLACLSSFLSLISQLKLALRVMA